jgi:hypothetical protein
MFQVGAPRVRSWSDEGLRRNAGAPRVWIWSDGVDVEVLENSKC